MASTDHYAASKASLRDTVKWLATTVAGLAAIVMAGAPFSDFGAVDVWSDRFLLSWAGLIVGTGCLFLVWWRLLRMLRSDAVFPTQLRDKWNCPPETPDWERDEFTALRKHLAAHGVDLLPAGIATFDGLEGLKQEAWDDWQRQPTDNALLGSYQQYADSVEMYLNYATFARLHRRVDEGILFIVGPTVVAAVALFVFAYAANPPTTPSDRVVVVQTGNEANMPTRTLSPIRFATGSANLDAPALKAIGAIRSFLLANETAGVLLLARTDATGGGVDHPTLAAERGAAVRHELLRDDAVAPSRVFVADMSRADEATPAPSTSGADARTVQAFVVAVPERK